MLNFENFFPSYLPKPNGEEYKSSTNLIQKIIDYINKNNQKISFEKFMDLCLYYPGFGYYSGGSQKFGREGDFITAPELTPLFSRCIANFCLEYLDKIRNCSILEFGAGSGKMAYDIILELEENKALPENYYILEVSSELQERQRKIINKLPSHLSAKVSWISSLPKDKKNYIVIANEVLDAMPISKFIWKDSKLLEYFVTYENQEFNFLLDKASFRLKEEFERSIIQYLKNENNYETEVNLSLFPWFKSLSDFIDKGVLLLIDYGFLAKEYYHPQRNRGTLMCHYYHRSHDNPLIFPGLQDITAHVNFSHVIDAAENAGFFPFYFETQANFLIENKIISYSQINSENPILQHQNTQALKYLLLPSEMGELFKVIALKSQAFSCPR